MKEKYLCRYDQQTVNFTYTAMIAKKNMKTQLRDFINIGSLMAEKETQMQNVT